MAVVNINAVEGAHKTNIMRLIGEFPEIQKDYIIDLYDYRRRYEENNAKIHDFIPMFCYRDVRELLLKKKRDSLGICVY